MTESHPFGKEALIACLAYVVGCFVFAEIWTAVIVAISPEAELSAGEWIAQFFFIGLKTAGYCLGGMIGPWAIQLGRPANRRPPYLTSLTFAAVASTVFIVGFGVSETINLAHGSALITVTSLTVALGIRAIRRQPSN